MCDFTRSGDNFESMSTSEIGEIVDIDDGFGEGISLLAHAWALLLHNTDLVKWAVCWVTGHPTQGDCLVDRIEGRGDNVNLRFMEGGEHDAYTPWNGNSLGSLWGGVIRLYEERHWQDYLGAWNTNGLGEDGAPVDRMCAAVDMACTLLHELTHVCWRAPNEDQDTFATSYLIENIFRWAMFRRYPAASQSACCSELGGEVVFGSDDSWWIGDGCIVAASTGASISNSAAAKNYWLEHKDDKPGTYPSQPERR